MKKLIIPFVAAALAVAFVASLGGAQPGRLSPQGGTITRVTAGSGMTGGGSAGPLTVDVVATTGGGLTVGADSIGLKTSCSSTQVLAWDGDSWECAAPGATYTAGDGLTLDGTEFNVVCGTGLSCAPDEVAVNISGTGGAPCAIGTAVTNVTSAGAASCGAVGDVESVTAGSGLTGGGTSGALTLDVGAGTNIDVAANTVDVEPSVSLAGEADTDTLDIANTASGQTSDVSGIDVDMTGSFNTTGGTKNAFGLDVSNSSTRSAGGNSVASYGIRSIATSSTGVNSTYGLWAQSSGTAAGLAYGVRAIAGTATSDSYGVSAQTTGTSPTNYAVYANAANGSANYSFYGVAGNIYNAGDATLDDTATINGKANADTLNVNNSNTGQTGTLKGIDTNLTGAWTSGTGPYVSYGVYSSNAMTGDVEADTLTHYGGYFSATGADTSYGIYATASAASGTNTYAAYFDAGRVVANGDVQLGNATTDQVDIDGDLTVDDAFTVSGNSQIGNASGDTLGVAATTTFTAAVSTQDAVTLGNDTGDQTTVSGDLTVNDDSDLSAGSTTVGDFAGTVQNYNGNTGTDFALDADATMVVISPTGSFNLSGFTGGRDGRVVLVAFKGSAFDITVQHDTTSTAANRIYTVQASSWTFSTNRHFVMLYDGTQARWLMIAVGTVQYPSFTINGTLTANGSTNTLTNDASDVVNVAGIPKDNGTAPTLSSCGTSPTVTGGSWAFTITAGTGGITACTATFASTKTNAPSCVVEYQDAAEDVYISSRSATAITLTAKTGTTDISGNVINVICIGDA